MTKVWWLPWGVAWAIGLTLDILGINDGLIYFTLGSLGTVVSLWLFARKEL